MNRYYYEDLTIGMKETFTVQITDEMFDSFYEITGDDNPLHRDEVFAKDHGFDGKVCYGMLTASFLSTLAGVYLPGERSLIQAVEVKFAKPVYAGDILTVEGEIEELNDTVKQVVLKFSVINHKGIKVLRGRMKVGVLNE